MITVDEIYKIGSFLKPHGIKGEIAAELDFEDLDLAALSCIVVSIDGIFVPFFIDSIRPKSHSTVLIHIEGVDSDAEAKAWSNQDFYALRRDLPSDLCDADGLDDDGNIYAEDLIGFRLVNSQCAEIGTVADFDDSTDNVVLIIERPNAKTVYIPFAGEFFTHFDFENRTAITDLPEGLIDL